MNHRNVHVNHAYIDLGLRNILSPQLRGVRVPRRVSNPFEVSYSTQVDDWAHIGKDAYLRITHTNSPHVSGNMVPWAGLARTTFL